MLKMCGLRRTEEIDAAAAAGATHVGFIRFPKSPRHLRMDAAAALARHAESAVRTVVVTVDAPDADIEAIVSTIRPDMIQLHGSESVERVAEIKARFDVGIVKAVPVRRAPDLELARGYEQLVDALLFDAKAPEGSDLPGGNGTSFDWTLLEGFRSGVPWFLSGGLDAGNLGEAMALTGARSLDLSSGIEDEPGIKSLSKIAAVGDAMRTAAKHERSSG